MADEDISSEQDLINITTGIISDIDIPVNSFSVQDFERVVQSEDIVKISARINFRKIQLPILMMIFKDLLNKSKIRVRGLKIDKEKEEGVSGFFDLICYAKGIFEEE